MIHQPVIFAIPPGLTDDDKNRLEGLATAFRGRRINKPVCYHFTPVRHKKFTLLWEMGFRVVPFSPENAERRFIHRASTHTFKLCDALILAEAMKTAAPALEEAPA